MATWETSITVTNLGEKRISVSATRTDGETSQTYALRTQQGDGESFGELKTRIGVALWAMHTASEAVDASNSALIGDAETAISTALNGQES